MAHSNGYVSSTNEHSTQELSKESNKKRFRSRSFLKSWTSKNKFVGFPTQSRLKPDPSACATKKLENEDDRVLRTQTLRRERPNKNTEERLRKTLFRRSLEAKLELENHSTIAPPLRRAVSEMPKLTENMRSLSNSAILDAVNEEDKPKKFVLCLSPKPSRPPNILLRSCSLNNVSTTGKLCSKVEKDNIINLYH